MLTDSFLWLLAAGFRKRNSDDCRAQQCVADWQAYTE